MTETQLKNKILRAIKQRWPDIWVRKISDMWHSGLPDLLMCVRGRFVAVELKVSTNKATHLQEWELKCIREAGGVGVICRSVDEVMQVLEEICERR